jgi:hypothetical protein
MPEKWVLTWARIAFVTFGRKKSAQLLEYLAFDSQKGAVDFPMSLDDSQRRTTQLHLPNGDIGELPVIEQIYAAQK